MIRLAIVAGVLCGSVIAYSQTLLPSRQNVPLQLRRQATTIQQSGTAPEGGCASVRIQWQGGTYSVRPCANSIPLYYQNGQVLYINGNVGKIGD
jgi:hypothetical protein